MKNYQYLLTATNQIHKDYSRINSDKLSTDSYYILNQIYMIINSRDSVNLKFERLLEHFMEI